MVYTFVLGMKYPAVGINGGSNGSPNHLGIRRMNGELEEIKHTALYVPLNPGERIEYRFAGGGGWGDPLERDPAKVRDDVLDEYVSREAAEREYGVMLTGELENYSLEVDEQATRTRRKELLAERSAGNGKGET